MAKRRKKIIIVDGRRGTGLSDSTTESMADARLMLIIQPDGTVRRVFHEDVDSEVVMKLSKIEFEFHDAVPGPGDAGAGDGKYEYSEGKDERMLATAKRLEEQKEAQGANAEHALDKFNRLWKD